MDGRRIAQVILLAVAAFSLFVAIRASFFGNGHGPVFWSAIGLIVLIAATALVGIKRLGRHS